MTEPIPAEIDRCQVALRSVHAFLHGELPDTTADEIRQHLMACERCVDNFDAEQFIGALLKRCYGPTTAPPSLRMRVSQLHVTWHADPPQTA